MRAAPPGFDLRELLDSLRDAVAASGWGRAPGRDGEDPRGDVLSALATRPMHGLEVIRHLDAAGTGATTAGTVYPILQQLLEEGLASSEQVGERRVYALTEAGRAAAADATTREGAAATGTAHGPRIPDLDIGGPLPRAALGLASAAAQVARDGTPAQRERAAALLDETRKRLYAVLAED